MVETLHYDPRRAGHTMATRPRKQSGHWEAPPEAPRSTFEDPGIRTYDPVTRTWVLEPLEAVPAVQGPGQVAMPLTDHSGVLWEVCEWDHRRRRYGQVMWVVEAATLSLAIAEKVRLCLARGFRPGWGRVRPVQ